LPADHRSAADWPGKIAIIAKIAIISLKISFPVTRGGLKT